ncbi:hypothetical protein R3P38DRAFT_2982891 [Favolaschia claudopus]|uniref:DUF6534 domain-containing protein n=1 Tax=Favolaschia claudopus TaxID=2862362 RepID=A0AAW0AZT4_9AGAR
MSSPVQTSAPNPSALPNYAPLLTAQLIGSLLTFFFFGTLLIQVYVYRLCFPKDHFALKIFVYFAFCALIVCTVLTGIDVEYWFGTGFGDISRFAEARNSPFYNPIMGSFLGLLVQSYFAYVIISIKRAAWPLALATVIIAMAQCAGGMGCGILSYLDRARYHDSTRTGLVYLWLAGSAAVNILIAASVTTLYVKTQQLFIKGEYVKSVVRVLIQTNIFTAIVALIGLILFAACQNTTYWVCPTMILAGIYANTLLVVLNNRSAPARGTTTNPTATTSSTGYSTNPPSSLRNSVAYSANGAGRVLTVPAMSFARQEGVEEEKKGVAQQVARPRSSSEREWRRNALDEAESESEYDE